ncbi:ATPase, T2SS/T4P/T4SS family [Escherichia coli]|uniref:ATPase, T2SS/T4P/T4SS family n=2 Tax=Escherichia coli TaxID=562 RepID=UPI0003A5379F
MSEIFLRELNSHTYRNEHWHFFIVEDDLLLGKNNERNYLIQKNIEEIYPERVQVDLSYLELTHKLKMAGLVLVDSELYYQLLEDISLENTKRRDINSSSIQQELEALLLNAVNRGASDLHITRGDVMAKVELRINGVLVLDHQMLSSKCDELIFVLYNVQASTRDTTWNRAIAQSANILYTLNERSYRFRYEHYPIFGESDGCYHCVLRIIPSGLSTVVNPDLAKLGVSDEEVRDIQRILSNPYGVYFIAGTTGSGKSTTLKNMMEWMQINRYDDKGCFLTVEDPVEYQIYGAKQSSVLDGENGGFHSAIKSSLRRDPDVLMVGEIRDPVSSNALAGAVESGHYCFTTVHAGNIVTLLQRLSALGISSDKLSTPGFIAGLQCQKLIPVLCDNCKLEHEVNILGRRFTLCKVNESGCERCKNTGVKSRQLVMEYLIPTQRELEALANQHWLNVYSIWREKRFTSSGISEGFSIKEKVFMHVLRNRACYQWFIMEFGEVPDTDMEVLLEKIQ